MKQLTIFLILLSSFSLFTQAQDTSDSDSTAYKGNIFPSPSLIYRPETGVVLGAFLFWQFKVPNAGIETRSSNASLWVAGSFKKQFFLELRHNVFTNKEKYFFDGYFLSRFYSEMYYGIGPDTKEENALDVSYKSHEFRQRVLRKIIPYMFLGPQYRFMITTDVEFKDQDEQPVTLPEIPGTEGSFESGLGVAYSWDKRNSILTPTQNFYIEISTIVYGEYLGGEHNFSELLLNARRYIDFNTKGKHVLAFEGLLNLTAGDVPFRELGKIGGSSINRGYLEGRFRDKNALQFQAEYRVNLIGRFGMTAFTGVGQVNDHFDEAFSKLIYSGGLGLRYNINKKDPANVRLDFGFTQESRGFYIGFGEAF